MDPAQYANVVDEMEAVKREQQPEIAALECPTGFVVGTGGPSGASEEEMRTVRAAAAEAEASNPRVSVFATRPTSTRRSSTRPPTLWSPRLRMSSTSLRDRRVWSGHGKRFS